MNIEIPGMTLLSLDHAMSQSMANTFDLKPQLEKNFAVLWQFFMGYLQGSPKIQISKLIFDTLLWA